MNFVVHDVQQRSDAWRQLRCGRVTSSRADDMLHAKLKSGGEPAARRDYRMQLVCERITGAPQEDSFQSIDMRRGNEREQTARLKYEAQTGVIVRPVGFISHDTLMAGYSPDGVIGEFRRLVEIKAPKAATHLRYLSLNGIPPEYVGQLHHGMWLTGAEACDFVSYHPSFPEPLQLFHVRVERKPAEIDGYELLLRQFLREVQDEESCIRRLALQVHHA